MPWGTWCSQRRSRSEARRAATSVIRAVTTPRSQPRKLNASFHVNPALHMTANASRLLRSRDSRRGAVPALAFVVFITAAILIALLVLLLRFLSIDEALGVVTIGILAGIVAWGWRTTANSLQIRAQLRILEILAPGKSLSQAQIRELVMREEWLFKLFRQVYADALSILVMSGKVVLAESGRYSLPSKVLPTAKARSRPKKGRRN